MISIVSLARVKVRIVASADEAVHDLLSGLGVSSRPGLRVGGWEVGDCRGGQGVPPVRQLSALQHYRCLASSLACARCGGFHQHLTCDRTNRFRMVGGDDGGRSTSSFPLLRSSIARKWYRPEYLDVWGDVRVMSGQGLVECRGSLGGGSSMQWRGGKVCKPTKNSLNH